MKQDKSVVINFPNIDQQSLKVTPGNPFTLQIEFFGILPKDDLTFDLYPIEQPGHPDRHYGYWVFNQIECRTYEFSLDFSRIWQQSVQMKSSAGHQNAAFFWTNATLAMDPLVDLQIVVRRKKKIIKLIHLNVQIGSDQHIHDFYHQGEGGHYEIDRFNDIFHQERTRLLSKCFKKYLSPHSTVLDAGSGRSIFYLLDNPVNAKVVCMDLNFHDFKPIQGEKGIYYCQASILACPCALETFDAVFCGEVVEHLPDPLKVFHQFNSLLKPGGILIFTTPNSHRMINRKRKYPAPLSREHINERNKREWEVAVKQANFDLVSVKGLYLELFLNWWQRNDARDCLRERKNLKHFEWITRILMRLGVFFPSIALDLVFVVRKKKESAG